MRSLLCTFWFTFLFIQSEQQLVFNPCAQFQSTSCPDGFLFNYAKCSCDQLSSQRCPGGYQWNGRACIIQISMEAAALIPSPRNKSCPHAQEKSESYLSRPRIVFPLLPKRVPAELRVSYRAAPSQECTNGFQLVAGECFREEMNCSDGYRLENDTCVEISPSCPEQFEYVARDKTCIQILSSIKSAQQTGTIEHSRRIDETTKPTCPENYVLDGYHCVFVGSNLNVDAPAIVEPVCAVGYRFDGLHCIRTRNEKNIEHTTPHCPDDYNYDKFNNICVAGDPYKYPSSVKPICNDGLTLIHNQCVVERQRPTELERPITEKPKVDALPRANVLSGNKWLQAPINRNDDSITRESNQTPEGAAPQCPEDYSYDRFSNICVASNPYMYPSSVRPTCEDRFILINNRCIAQHLIETTTQKPKVHDLPIDNIVGGNKWLQQPTSSLISNENDRSLAEMRLLVPAHEAVAEDQTCCSIISPRICRRLSHNSDTQWQCYNNNYRRCGSFCTKPKMYLRPKSVVYNEPLLIMPPAPKRLSRLLLRHRSREPSNIGEFF